MTKVISSQARNLGHLKIYSEARNDQYHYYWRTTPFLGYLWRFGRLFIKAPAGRKRFNVLGALNAITHQIVTVDRCKNTEMTQGNLEIIL